MASLPVTFNDLEAQFCCRNQSAKFVQNPSRFTKVIAKHILVCFLCPTVYVRLIE